MGRRRQFRATRAGTAVAVVALIAVAISPAGAGGSDDTVFYVPKEPPAASQQIAELMEQERWEDAARIHAMVTTPQAVWIESESPKRAQQQVRATTRRAAARGTVPVLVAYNIPFRDCAQYSAGGATTVTEYETWIDAVAAGIGDREAIVILEPDGLGIIPHYTTINGDAEWCRPGEADPETAADDRFAMLNYAVDALKAQPRATVYLDGTHSGWLGVGDAADRLIEAGVTDADGFFLNVSNYQTTQRQLRFGDWISQCIHLDRNSWFQRDWCASQYHPADPDDLSSWAQTDAAYDQAYADTGLSRDPAAMPHYVIDTSRNGQGPWTPDADYPDPQDWCNPPNRGLGLRPTTGTGSELADAYLWVKIPGESDGHCLRGTQGPEDPARGTVDPAAGTWFPEQALELARLADPPLDTRSRPGRGPRR